MITATAAHPATWVILAILDLACWFYGFRIVRAMRRAQPDHGQTAWLVAVGVSLVIVAGAAIVAVTAGIATAIDWTAFVLLLFVAAGLPMIIEYVGDHIHRQRSARQTWAEIQAILIGGKDKR